MLKSKRIAFKCYRGYLLLPKSPGACPQKNLDLHRVDKKLYFFLAHKLCNKDDREQFFFLLSIAIVKKACEG